MAQRHQTKLDVSGWSAPDVEAGAAITLAITVSCSGGCDLRGSSVIVMADEGVVMATELASYANNVNATADVALTVPRQLGEYAWNIVFPGHETDCLVHEASAVAIPFRTVAHKTSVAVWDSPSPVVRGELFTVKVGVQCSASCRLAGQIVEIRDEKGERAGEGCLGDSPWAGTKSLYWTEIQLTAPAVEGVFSRFAHVARRDAPVAHADSVAGFSFRVDNPPEHTVKISVVDGKTGLPVEGAEVRLGLYRACTDDRGIVSLHLPTASYDVSIRAEGYSAPPVAVDVTADLTLHVDAFAAPTRAEIEEKLVKFEEYPWG